jgi:hypothetical protein
VINALSLLAIVFFSAAASHLYHKCNFVELVRASSVFFLFQAVGAHARIENAGFEN